MRHPTLEKRCVIEAQRHNLNTIIDVGANKGQFANRIRALGWRGKIMSFEPLIEPFKLLEKQAEKDPKHFVYQYGLGDENIDTEINVASNHGASSSILEFNPSVSEAFSITTVSKESVRIRKIIDVYSELSLDLEKSLLKIDTQGFEKQVLKGAGELLEKIPILLLEVSMRKVYMNEPLILELLNFLDSKGFELRDIEPSVFATPSQPFQCDIMCLRKRGD
jgi:FkbM family methyltransferase